MYPVDFVLIPTIAYEYMAFTGLMNAMCFEIMKGWTNPWGFTW